MKVNETIRLLEWENERGSDEMERISNECELLHDQVIGLANEVACLKDMLEKLSGSSSENAGAVNPYDIEEDDITF